MSSNKKRPHSWLQMSQPFMLCCLLMSIFTFVKQWSSIRLSSMWGMGELTSDGDGWVDQWWRWVSWAMMEMGELTNDGDGWVEQRWRWVSWLMTESCMWDNQTINDLLLCSSCDEHTGKFTVPAGGAGLYYFSTYLLLADGKEAVFRITKNGENDDQICSAWGDQNHHDDEKGQGACSGLADLNDGECSVQWWHRCTLFFFAMGKIGANEW